MKVVELKDIRRKESPIHYIREFNARAVLQGFGGDVEQDILITIESRPFGGPDVRVAFVTHPDWPVLPLIKSLKHLVIEMDRGGSLP